jgi:hypothetical protein
MTAAGGRGWLDAGWSRLGLVALMVGSTMILAACDEDGPSDPTPPCAVSISPVSRGFGSGGGTGTVAVTTTPESCAWTSTSSQPWVTIQGGATGQGAGTVTYEVAANASEDARSATVTIGGVTHTVTQEGKPSVPCTYAISPASASFMHAGGTGSFSMTAPAGCTWTAVSSAAFVAITSGSGSGDGTIQYTVAENDSIDSRAATIAVGGQTFTVMQAGESVACEYSVAPVSFSPCMGGGTLSTMVTAPASCTWTASVSQPWLSIVSGTSGSGTGVITFAFTDNYDAPRDGTVMVRWPTPTAGQNVRVEQAGCLYATTVTSISIGSAGGSSSFDVLQQAVPNSCGGPLQDRCIWSATTSTPWITITTPMPTQGDNRVNFTVAPNGTGTARTGTIVVKDKVVTIIQAG